MLEYQLTEIAKNFENVIESTIISRSKTGIHKPSGFRASEAGMACPRYHYHNIVDWFARPSPQSDLLGVFQQGELNERELVKDLIDAGIDFRESQSTYEDKELGIVGRIDGIIVFNKKKYPVEIKSLSPFTFDTITRYEDMIPSPSKPAYFASWTVQLPIYLELTGEDSGFYILRNKVNRMTRFIPVTKEQAKEMLKIAKRALKKAKDAIAQNRPPKPAPAFPNLCETCWVRSVGLCPGANQQVFRDLEELPKDELQVLAAEIKELEPAHKRYEKLRDQLSSIIQPVAQNLPEGEASILLQDNIILVKRYTQKYYDVPSEIREQYQKERTITRITIK